MTIFYSPLPGTRARIISEKGKSVYDFSKKQPQSEPKLLKFMIPDSPPQQQDVILKRQNTVGSRPEPLRQSLRTSKNAFSRDPNPNGILEFNYGESFFIYLNVLNAITCLFLRSQAILYSLITLY